MSDDYEWQGFPGEAEMVRAKRAAEAKANSLGSGQTPAAPSDPSMNSGQAPSTGSGQALSTGSGQEPLSQKQQAALAELQRGTPFKTAAERVGVHQATLYRWIKSDPTFRAAYNLWEQATRESARAKLLAAADIAVNKMVRMIDVDHKFAFAVLKEMGIFRQRPAGQIDPEPARQEIELEMKTDLTALKARLAQLAEIADVKKPVQSRIVRTLTHQQPADAPADRKCEKCESVASEVLEGKNGK